MFLPKAICLAPKGGEFHLYPPRYPYKISQGPSGPPAPPPPSCAHLISRSASDSASWCLDPPSMKNPCSISCQESSHFIPLELGTRFAFPGNTRFLGQAPEAQIVPGGGRLPGCHRGALGRSPRELGFSSTPQALLAGWLWLNGCSPCNNQPGKPCVCVAEKEDPLGLEEKSTECPVHT